MRARHLLFIAALAPLAACARGDAAPTVTTAPAARPAAAQPAAAAQPPQAGDKADPRIALAAKIPGTKPEDLRPTPVPGIYELTQGADVSYVTADGKYAFAGDLYQITPGKDFPNLSELRRRELRLARLASVPESQMLLFGPAKAQHTVTVFTDVDCPWCQRLHAQVGQYNKLGIRVRYMFFPRTGPDTDSWHKAEAVWCSSNRNEALTRAKNGEDIKSPKCPTDIIKRDFELGQKLAVEGTPAIFLASGEMLPGYAPPGQLVKYLKSGGKM